MESPQDFLQRFLIAVSSWEEHAARLSASALRAPHEFDPDLWKTASAQINEELTAIFREFCLKGKPRGGTTYAIPPAHDPQNEKIQSTQETATGVRITTKRMNGFQQTLIYTLRRTKTGWRLLDNRTELTHEGTEIPWGIPL